jgi:hypothetical protein
MREAPASLSDACALAPDVYAAWRTSQVGALTDCLERRLILELLQDVRDHGILDVGCCEAFSDFKDLMDYRGRF